MQIPHFFKARSRIGIINNPNKQKSDNIGVEHGAEYILDYKFLNNFNEHLISNYEFPTPENISPREFFGVLENSISHFKDLINRQIKNGEIQVVIGGDHSVSLPSVLALIERKEDVKQVGYIHFDSHADINLYKESPSKNFHGMYLRPLFDDFDISQIDSLLIDKIPIENLLMVGNLDLDEGEFSFINNKHIKVVARKDLINEKEKTLKYFNNFVKKFKYLHVSFDGDVLDRSEFIATGIPCENGYRLKEIMEFIKIIKKHPNLSFDISEYNPIKDRGEKSKKIVQQILLEVLQ